MEHQARLVRHREVATALALLGDHQLAELVDGAQTIGAGVGGATALLDIGGAPVFVKRIPLTDLERRPQHVRSTANVFELPTFCQHGVVAYASGGFGAWRELAANTMTTDWVLAGQTEAFPLLYHWRVLPGAAPPTEEHADLDRVVEYWDGSAAVRRRLDALAQASASLVLFLEYVPQRLDTWLADRLAEGPDAIAAACTMVQRRLSTDIAFMNGNGLLHFDAHFRNILTDGRRLYLTDLGLATSPRFDLAPDEQDFVARHSDYDAGYVMRELVNWIVANVVGIANTATGGPLERFDYIRRWAAGDRPADVPESIAELLTRHAPAATVLNDFIWSQFGVSRTTPFPDKELEQALR